MILKFIETNTTPKMGDLVKSKRGWIGIFGQHENSYKDECTVVKPYGISDDEVTGHGFRLDVERNTIGIIDDDDWYRIHPNKYKFKKVNILPEQFNYQEIVDLGLKDGDELNVYSVDNVIGTLPNNQVMLLEPTPVTYTEEEVKELYECLEELAGLMQGVIDGEYKPDSFTTQPARKVLANFKKK